MKDKEKLVKLLKEHDWWFEMSDDHRVWLRGNRELSEINSCMRKINEDEAIVLWNKYCPEHFKKEKNK